jgi:hypothetical protein
VDSASQYDFAIPKEATAVTIVLAGDVNQDGVLNVDDMTALSDANELSEVGKLVADLNGNGKLTTADRILLARALVGENHKAYKALEW